MLFLGIVLFQATNFQVVCNVQRLYVRQAEKTRAEQLASYWFLFEAMNCEERRAAVARMRAAGRPESLREMVEILPHKPDWESLAGADDRERIGRLRAMVAESFGSALDMVPPVLARKHENGAGIFPVHLPVLETAIELSDGTWLKVTQPFEVDDRKVVWSQRLFVLAEALVMLVLVAVVLLRVTRPIQKLCSAADAFGRHPELAEPLPEKGVREVRDAAQVLQPHARADLRQSRRARSHDRSHGPRLAHTPHKAAAAPRQGGARALASEASGNGSLHAGHHKPGA